MALKKMITHEVTLIIKTPEESDYVPSLWNWPNLLEVNENEVIVVSDTVVGETTYYVRDELER